MGIPVHQRSLKSAEVKACMMSGAYLMIMLVDKARLGSWLPWAPDAGAANPEMAGYTGAHSAAPLATLPPQRVDRALGS